MIRIVLRKKRLAQLCQTLLDNKIYSPFGRMRYWYKSQINGGDSIQAISVAYNNKKVIGACILLSEKETFGPNSHNIGTFIKCKYRRRGIGKRLVERIKEVEKNLLVWKGNKESRGFYGAINL